MQNCEKSVSGVSWFQRGRLSVVIRVIATVRAVTQMGRVQIFWCHTSGTRVCGKVFICFLDSRLRARWSARCWSSPSARGECSKQAATVRVQQGGDLTRPYPALRPYEVTPCHLISISDIEVLGLFRAFSTLYAIAVPPGVFERSPPWCATHGCSL